MSSFVRNGLLGAINMLIQLASRFELSSRMLRSQAAGRIILFSNDTAAQMSQLLAQSSVKRSNKFYRGFSNLVIQREVLLKVSFSLIVVK